MKKILLLVPFLFLPLACKSTPADLAAFKALQADMAIVGPDYQAYLKADPKYTSNEDLRTQKIKLVDDMVLLLSEKVK